MDSRVQLKPAQWKDMAFIRWMWSDPDTMAPVGGPVHLTDEQARQWFAQRVDPGSPAHCYRLILNEENRPVGEISFHHLDPDTMTAMFNVKIVSTERGKGYAREAMRVFLDYFFNQVGGRVMIDSVALDNLTGQRVLLDFGFEHDPSEEDVFMLRMTRERYNDRYASLRQHGWI